MPPHFPDTDVPIIDNKARIAAPPTTNLEQ